MDNRIKNWPIVKLTEKRDEFLNEVIEDAYSIILSNIKLNLSEEIAKALYLEKIRIAESHWNIDPSDEKQYWDNIKKRLLKTSLENENSPSRIQNEQAIAKDIITRYVYEIGGNFKIPTYKFASKAVPFLFSRLLNTASSRNFGRFWNSGHRLQDRIVLRGDLDTIRSLEKHGTIILMPTHFSNLDSILVGYALREIGLPPFIYGAGLNLYNNRLVGYFINRLGAYKVDRRKKNLFYLEALKSYSRVVLKRGCHSLFFPGGTRSRSGAIETKLKLGLLGTAFDAQLHNFQKDNEGNPKKIFILPLVIGYHFVLEGDSLIKEHLTRTGKEKYFIDNDQFSSWFRILRFVWDFFSKGTRITLSFGKPMDMFGNYVDEHGESHDKTGKRIDISHYFYSGGELKSVPQRDHEYTKLLGERIVEEYFKENTILSSHLIAYVAFEMISKRFPKLDLYGVLRLSEEDSEINYTEFESKIEAVLTILKELEKNDQVKIANHCKKDIPAVIRHGFRNLGLYHSKRVLYKNEKDVVLSDDLNLLYFYHNRMEGYGLKKYI